MASKNLRAMVVYSDVEHAYPAATHAYNELLTTGLIILSRASGSPELSKAQDQPFYCSITNSNCGTKINDTFGRID